MADRSRLDSLEVIKNSAQFIAKTKTVTSDRYQWSAIANSDAEILMALGLAGFRITISATNLQALDKAIETERRKVEREEDVERRRDLEDMEREMRTKILASAPAPAPAPAFDPNQFSAMIAQAVAAALASQQKTTP